MSAPVFELTRHFAAPVSVVFDHWTDADLLRQWWGRDMELGVCEVELAPGGFFYYSMFLPNPAGGDQLELFGKWDYSVVEVPSRLEFENYFSNDKREVTHHFAARHWPAKVHNTVTFLGNGTGCDMTMHSWPSEGRPEDLQAFYDGFDGMREGFDGVFVALDEQLKKYLASPNG
jgi:uncharacterized protein YndB with AHSA1/START domain